MHLRMRIASAGLAVAALAGAVAATAGPASAHIKPHPSVTITDTRGVLTSGSYLHLGEALLGAGYPEVAGQQYTVTSLHESRGLWVVGLSPVPSLPPGATSATWDFFPNR